MPDLRYFFLDGRVVVLAGAPLLAEPVTSPSAPPPDALAINGSPLTLPDGRFVVLPAV